jgi:hypothetical protein
MTVAFDHPGRRSLSKGLDALCTFSSARDVR